MVHLFKVIWGVDENISPGLTCNIAEVNDLPYRLIHQCEMFGDKQHYFCCNIHPTRYKVTQFIFLETALHVSGGTPTHHQEHKQLYVQQLIFVTPLLLSTAIVEELELV